MKKSQNEVHIKEIIIPKKPQPDEKFRLLEFMNLILEITEDKK
jgi:hypothetical protein